MTVVKTVSTIAVYGNGRLERTRAYGACADPHDADLLLGPTDAEGAYLGGRAGQVELFGRALRCAAVWWLNAQANWKYLS